MKKIRSLMVVAITSASCNLLFSQSTVQSKQLTAGLDSIIQKAMEKIPVIPGIAVTVVDENGPVVVKGYGFADKEKNIRADENTFFYIASNTKAFLALAASLLDQEKKILLDSSFKRYFTRSRFKNEIPDSITVRNLLTHTSGLENNALVFRTAFSGAIDEKEILKVLTGETVFKKPPGEYDYDNLGYNMYGMLLQESMNITWQDLLEEKIFSPLGMKHTITYVSAAEKNSWQIAAPYYAFGEKGLTKLESVKKDNTMHAAGGLFTTASDMAIWLQVQINNGKLRNKQVFPAAVIQAARTGFAPYEIKERDSVIRSRYGLGWNESKYKNEDYIWHTGGYFGYRSYLSFMPGKKIGVAVMANESSVTPIVVDFIVEFIYDWVTGSNEAEDIFLKKLDRLQQLYTGRAESSRKSYEERAKRESQLTMPLDAYIGKYNNDLYGEIEITIENNTLGVWFGNLHAVSTPFTQKESIRVQLQPDIGEVIYFKTNESGKVTGLTYNKLEFIKK